MSLHRYLLPFNLLGELIIIALWILCSGVVPTLLDIFFFLTFCWMVSTLLTKNYYINRLPGLLINALNLSKHFLLYFLFLFVYLQLVHKTQISHKQIITFSLWLYVFLLIWRIFVFTFIKRTLKASKNRQPVIIAGVSVASIHFKEFVEAHPEYGIHILGFFTNKTNEKVNVLGPLSDLIPFCQNNKISEIICSADKLSKDDINNILEYCENNFISLKIIPDSAGFLGRTLVTTFIEHMPLLALHKNPFDEATNQFLKRGFDILFSLTVIVFVLSWLMAIIAILIKLSSKGPVFFLQERSGIRNKSFKCFKFRSMRTEKNAEFKQATKNDSRVTKIGAFIRKTSLDELPQFFNVLIGNMSIVGPRPHPLKLTEEYSQKVDRYMVRHLVKPGITGLSQVMGYRGETQHDLYLMKMRVRMDRFYIDNWSFYLDLKVVWATVLLMFRKDTNAY
ncbi:MAG: undecaprenyl-phosphate glucose phosphotransferase [Bacteroidota bacterium]|nr:undecaprenyl-phosphate glucose phosphotransferase [Bacteroidota bacterium]